MSQLTFASIPGFADLADANIGPNKVLTDDSMVKISQNAKFAAVRAEIIFMGFYKHGDTIGVPTSPVDGYAYSRAEVMMDFTLFSTRPPASGFISGQATAPGIGASQPANLYWFIVDINDATGVVSITTSYYKQGGAETTQNDGIVKVYAICQRSSINVAN